MKKIYLPLIAIVLLLGSCASPAPIAPATAPAQTALPATEPPPTATNTAIPPTATTQPSPTPLPGALVIPITSMQGKIPWLPLDKANAPVVNLVGFNTRQPPFDNADVRAAFALAIDRVVIAEMAAKYTRMPCTPATTLTPPSVLGLDLYGQAGWGYDPVAAAQMLAQAGYQSGESFPKVFILVTARGDVAPGARFNMATKMAEMWKQALGVSVEVKTTTLAFKPAYEQHQPHMYWFGWVADINDPSNFLDELYHSGKDYNWGGYSSADFDSLVEKARAPSSPAFRQRLYVQAEQWITETDHALIPLYHTSMALP